jgi:hypothetical protein
MNFLKIKIFLKRFLKKLAYYVVNNFGGTFLISFFFPYPYSIIPSMFLTAFIENRIEKTKYLIALGWQFLGLIVAIISALVSQVTEEIYAILGSLIALIVLAFVRAKVEKK